MMLEKRTFTEEADAMSRVPSSLLAARGAGHVAVMPALLPRCARKCARQLDGLAERIPALVWE